MTILIALAGVNTGNNLIYLTASFLLAYMLISGWIAQLNLKGIVIHVRYPDEIFANVAFPVFVHVQNRKKFIPSFFIDVKVGDAGRFLFWVPSRATISLTLYDKCTHRGINRMPAPRICSSFPFNFFTRMRYAGDPVEITVFPEPKKCDLSALQDPERTEDGGRENERTYDFENLVSIRNYIPGDPWKFINWKATAKTGELKVNELDSGRPGSFVFDLIGLPEEYYEELLSCYTYLILELSRSGVPLGVKTPKVFIPPGTGRDHVRRILTVLATYNEPQTGY
ncbi:DUF58 domain-containing protein [Thermodesulforhabdus norvegica]|uniref:Uncharacterized protein n=1 Tax=Thermodesulforhabdus norvegica TaxID=39841 RepID=A0A1I4VE98_9BACT|nr:DUF58 domain-containing protein [Thermodesulforhabdus norvegica]SFM99499.1 Protein of unknown function DUF58 [Thermodesulforhabdus norvegica]